MPYRTIPSRQNEGARWNRYEFKLLSISVPKLRRPGIASQCAKCLQRYKVEDHAERVGRLQRHAASAE